MGVSGGDAAIAVGLEIAVVWTRNLITNRFVATEFNRDAGE